jgi:hypothetical protein
MDRHDKACEKLRAMTRFGEKQITTAAESKSITDTEVISYAIMLAEWTPNNYTVGAVRIYDGTAYRCVQAHDSTPNPTWTPSEVPALWAILHGTTPETAQPYRMMYAEDKYMSGEYMIYEDGNIYKCLEDNTTWSPIDTPTRWQKTTENPNDDGENPNDTQPEVPETPAPEEYIAGKWYQLGDMITYNGRVYKSIFNGNNVWSPDGYAAGWELVS